MTWIDQLKEAVEMPWRDDGWKRVAVAARLVTEGEDIWRCTAHNADGVPRLSTPMFTCWKAEFIKHLDVADCVLVRRRLIDIPDTKDEK